MRGRVDCSPTREGYNVSDISSWLVEYDLTDTTVWNQSINPPGINKGYQLRNMSKYAAGYRSSFVSEYDSGDETRKSLCPIAPNNIVEAGAWTDFSGDLFSRFPFVLSDWPVNFTATYLQGVAQTGFFGEMPPSVILERLTPKDSCANGPDRDGPWGGNYSLFTEIPTFQSMTCRPIIETANATITTDVNGHVSSYSIRDEPTTMEEPWKHVLEMYVYNSSSYPEWKRTVDKANITSR